MVRKLFIVARGNTSVYGFLQRTVGQEEDVAIIYDRRASPPRPKRLARLRRGARRMLFRPTATAPPARPLTEERRRHAAIDAEIRSRGWAVVHLQLSR
jgi:hypothetical protein